jgi:phosphoheptose isomerase
MQRPARQIRDDFAKRPVLLLGDSLRREQHVVICREGGSRATSLHQASNIAHHGGLSVFFQFDL